MQAADFMSVAQSLATSTHAEREWRTAAGRAYYAVFLSVRDALPIQRQPNEGAHQAVERALRARDRFLAQSLSKLKRRRIHCDYDLAAPFGLHDATDQIREAERLLRDLRRAGIT
jgi:uncharacterized protein (UPF0332 family)